ncbi:hypothetical protein BC938DRAFT_473133 [Jimgerdemannia flammicorona]|uniref:Uncharacterized protein n=1 Tax=Jimgerdemannia flammicorona TaxID=994334 RepID=A0A433Q4N1_9FUNG|nr:hypothetical protein BC938DRAFT_473133 [Jimgerdemannia flammicorona]
MCVVEEKRRGSGSDERVRIGIVAVQPLTGEIAYDSFDNGYMRSELEPCVLHIQPCKMLLPAQLSKSIEKLMSHMALHRYSLWRCCPYRTYARRLLRIYIRMPRMQQAKPQRRRESRKERRNVDLRFSENVL